MSGPMEKWVAELPEKYVVCRDTGLRHKWEPWTATFDKFTHQYTRSIHCETCGTVKEQVVDAEGYIVKTKTPRYPEGYLRPKGSGRMTKDDAAIVRVESMLRFMDRTKGLRRA